MDIVKNTMDMGVVVRPQNGMQLAAGQISLDRDVQFVGYVPGLAVQVGESPEEVRCRLENVAQDFYGTDVVVEIPDHPGLRGLKC